jgi:hypothetical protein
LTLFSLEINAWIWSRTNYPWFITRSIKDLSSWLLPHHTSRSDGEKSIVHTRSKEFDRVLRCVTSFSMGSRDYTDWILDALTTRVGGSIPCSPWLPIIINFNTLNFLLILIYKVLQLNLFLNSHIVFVLFD